MVRPFSVPDEVRKVLGLNGYGRDAMVIQINYKYLPRKFQDPDVSIVIPALNEAEMIVFTLLSLCQSNTSLKFEIIVVDNNSRDDTQFLVRKMGIRCLHETVPGITAARNAGLGAARGKYILSADADTIYPPGWIDAMVRPLMNQNDVAATYGRFAFLPGAGNGRLGYFLYEYCADISRWITGKFSDEAANVYGFNFAFRRDQAYAADWFNHPGGAKEDGWLALKLRDKGFGKLIRIDSGGFVWTANRKIQKEGGLLRAFGKRVAGSLFDRKV